MSRLILILISLTAFILAGCGDGGQAAGGVAGRPETDEPADNDGDNLIDGVPAAVNEWFSLEDLQLLHQAGMEIYTGEEPPTIEGNYIANTLRIIYDSAGMTGNFMQYTYWFEDQDTDATLLAGYISYNETDSAESAAYISGEDDCFSVFALIEGHSTTDDCTYRRATVYSGCLDSTASIAGFSFGFIMTGVEGDCSDTLPEDHLRVIKKSDDLAVLHD